MCCEALSGVRWPSQVASRRRAWPSETQEAGLSDVRVSLKHGIFLNESRLHSSGDVVPGEYRRGFLFTNFTLVASSCSAGIVAPSPAGPFLHASRTVPSQGHWHHRKHGCLHRLARCNQCRFVIFKFPGAHLRCCARRSSRPGWSALRLGQKSRPKRPAGRQVKDHLGGTIAHKQ